MNRSNLLSVVEAEVEAQPAALDAFLSTKIPSATDESIFVGSGDSFTAGLTAFYVSSGRFRAFDPYTISASPKIASGKDVYFVSVSGRTLSNIRAARALSGVASRTIAITADPNSPLAKETEETIPIPYETKPRTVGILSFSLTIAACIKLTMRRWECNFAGALSKARHDSKSVLLSKVGTTYFLGNHVLHATSIYAASKMHEMLGWKSSGSLLEGFGHAELFSVTPSDSVNIFSAFDPSKIARRLTRALRRRGYKASLLADYTSRTLENVFYAIFLVQLSTVGRAKLEGLDAPYFTRAREKLELSDDIIY